MGAGVAADQVAERVGHRLEEGLRDADRQRAAQGVTQPPGVLDRGPALLTGDAHPDQPAGPLEVDQPAADLVAGQGLLRPSHDLVEGQRTQDPQQVGDVLGVAAGALGHQPLELGLGAGDLLGVEQVAQGQALAPAEQLGQQGRVERQGGGALLGQR